MTVALLLALAAFDPSASARSEPQLQWDAPVGCPTRDEVSALLTHELADLPPAQRDEVHTWAHVESGPHDRFEVTVVVRQGARQTRRVLEVDSCAATVEAVALVVGLVVTPNAESPTESLPVEPDPSTATVVSDREPTIPSIESPPHRPEPTDTTADPAPSIPARSGPRAAIRAAAGLGLGWVGSPGGQVLAAAGLRWPRLHVGLRADHAIRRRPRLEAPADAGGNVSMTTAGLEAGPVLPIGPVDLLVLGMVHAGGARARGVGVPRKRVRWVAWAVAGLGVQGMWRVSPRVGLGAGVELGLALVRHTFMLDDVPVLRTSVVGGRLWAGIELKFPK